MSKGGADIRLIPVSASEAERLRVRAETALDPDFLQCCAEEWGDEAAALAKEEAEFFRSIASRYEDGVAHDKHPSSQEAIAVPYRVKQRFMWIEALAMRGKEGSYLGDADVALVEIRNAAREAYTDFPEVAQAAPPGPLTTAPEDSE